MRVFVAFAAVELRSSGAAVHGGCSARAGLGGERPAHLAPLVGLRRAVDAHRVTVGGRRQASSV